MCKCLCGE